MTKIALGKPKTFSTLFQGKLLNYVECVNVDYTSTTDEEFSDIPLNVKDCRNVYESSEKYAEVGMIEGDNKYRADGLDELQAARKDVKLLKSPPVLQLHLKHFEFELTRFATVNDFFLRPSNSKLCIHTSLTFFSIFPFSRRFCPTSPTACKRFFYRL